MSISPSLANQLPTGLNSGITGLSLHNYRNYDSYKLTASLKPIVIVGPNGAGKTNILEAISMLAPGRGLRRAHIGELTNVGNPETPWAIRAEISQNNDIQTLATGLDPDAMAQGKEKRVVKLNGENIKSQAELNSLIHVSWLTPQMDRIFIDPSAGRRQFLDRLVYGLDPGHVTRLRKYEHYTRERSKLLRERNFNDSWLGALENKMAEEGVAIACARRNYASQINSTIDTIPSAFPKANLTMSGDIDTIIDNNAQSSEDNARQILAQNRRIDAESGTTKFGPHRSDLITKFMPEEVPAQRCSTGEQKALLISIILASVRVQSMWGQCISILLLDEVVAHLDLNRRAQLYDDITNIPIQTWITGTDEQLFEPIMQDCQLFKIAHL